MNGYAVSVDEKYALESGSVKYKKMKKPGFIKRWLYKISEEAWNHKKYQESESDLNLARPSRGPIVERHGLDSNPMVMKIYRANGGTIVETTTYDRQKDRNQNQLHIIGHDTDLGHGLSKIITMESLRQ